MQLCPATRCSSSCTTRRSRTSQLHVRAQAPLTGSTAGASSNSTGASSVPPLCFDRPAGGGSRSFDLPRSSDLLTWAPRSDIAMRPSGGAARGAVFATSNGAAGGAGSAERPGGRSGRGDMPSGWDSAPSNPQNPAEARPGGRAGRDSSLSSIDQPSGGSIDSASSNPQNPAEARPGGRAGRDSSLSSIDQGGSTPSIDRPGGRGGRDGPSDGGSGGGGGGSGGDGSSGGGQEGGSGGGIGVGSVALYAGVIAAAWFGHKALFPEKQPEPVKPCCAGKGKKK